MTVTALSSFVLRPHIRMVFACSARVDLLSILTWCPCRWRSGTPVGEHAGPPVLPGALTLVPGRIMHAVVFGAR
jgi:uncharacterized membrane protein